MTQHSTSEIAGQDGAPTLTPLSAGEFAAVCREIVATSSGHDAHRRLDRVTTELLVSLGYGEGVSIFSEAVHQWHHPQLDYPFLGGSLRCRLGRHAWAFDRESDAPWAAPEICTRCGKRRSFNPCP